MVREHFTVPQNLVTQWDDVLSDMEEMAAGYRKNEWDTYELHPGHVAVLPEDSDRTGFEALVPDNEFDPLVSVHDPTVDEFKVLREESNGLAYRLVVAEDRAKRVVVFIPIYYEFPAVDRLRVEVEEEGSVQVYVRPLSKEKGVLGYTLDEPELLFPDA